MVNDGWVRWLHEISGGLSPAELTRRIGVSQATHSKWKRGAKPDAELAVHVARYFGRPALEALIVLGIITAEESSVTEVNTSLPLTEVTDLDLVTELHRRIAERNHNESPEGLAERMRNRLG